PEPNAIGSFEYDIQHNYTLRWPNWDAMRHWMKAESSEKSIEFLKKETPAPHPGITAWLQTHVYVCARQGTGGKSAYKQKHAWTRKVGSKRTGCPCRLTIKTYPGTPEVLGFYKSEHSHSVGDDNVKFTRLDSDTRLEIEALLRL
ncbi:hypothetical protein C8J57DRAFT_1022103, partial [Mycena rebaudengoi]